MRRILIAALALLPLPAAAELPDLAGREVVGVECLVRWVHPVLGIIAPDRFIPLAEQTGQIRHLTRWLLETTARQMRLAEDRGLLLRWAVNISAVDLLSPDFAQSVGDVLRVHGLAPGRLVVEVTESAAMSDPENAIRQLAALRHMGVKLSIDDYGTGHASMAQLKRLPVDELKIDRSFVRSLNTDTNDQAIVASTIALAHRLGLSVAWPGRGRLTRWLAGSRAGRWQSATSPPGQLREPACCCRVRTCRHRRRRSRRRGSCGRPD